MGRKDKEDEYGLTRVERTFADEYILTKNKRASAIKAGIKATIAGTIAGRMLKKEHINNYVTPRLTKMAAQIQDNFDVTQERLIRELAAIALLDPAKMYDENGDLLPIHKMDEMTRRAIAGMDVKELTDEDGKLEGYLRKVKMNSKIAAIELLGRHLMMWSKDGEGGGSILNINIITDKNQLDHPNYGKVIENGVS